MINIIWCFLMVIAIVFAIANGTVTQTVNAVADGAKSAVSLTILLMGTMAFWLGITKIADKSGITSKINKLLSPIVAKLFPEYKNNVDVSNKITMNMTANMLGLGNAATPLGLSAMASMSSDSEYPSKSMILFVIINTASLQIIPTQMAALRSAYGSTSPFEIMPQIWITSIGSLVICIMLCKILERRYKWHT